MAAYKLMQRLKPAEVRGTVVGVPVLNVGAFEAFQRGNPVDLSTYDLNRTTRVAPTGI